jgi:hypothetical protein
MKGIMMQDLTLQDMADLLDCASIEQTIDLGHSIIHIGNTGTSDKPCRFVLINDYTGKAILAT